jgi:hypothetical protein
MVPWARAAVGIYTVYAAITRRESLAIITLGVRNGECRGGRAATSESPPARAITVTRPRRAG